jgi:hypothetical protein
MTWRSIQLNQQLCDQDQVILKLFDGKDVKYVGNDFEFRNIIGHRDESNNLVLIINHSMWCSNIVKLCTQYLAAPINTFYIGINRYCIKGNDTEQNFLNTDQPGLDIIAMLEKITKELGYTVTQSGSYDRDLGRHFNFVQPLTWVYGSKTNASN